MTVLVQQARDFMDRFEWNYGETPLSSWWAPASACLAYVVLLPLLWLYMRKREALSMRLFAIFHNGLLCVFSLAYVLFFCYEFFKVIMERGVIDATCDHEGYWQGRGSLYFLLYVFYLSKYYELLDTALLIVKKKPVIFLHAYHHPATLVLCYICLEYGVSLQWLCTTANAIVHTFMYYYYLMAILRVPVWWKRYITIMQIVQFVLDLFGNSFVYAYNYWAYGVLCGTGGWFGFGFGQAILFSYLLLFVEFYFKSYTGGGSKPGTASSGSVSKKPTKAD